MRSHIACLPYPKVLGAYPKRSFHIQQSSPAQPTLHTQTSLQKPVLSAFSGKSRAAEEETRREICKTNSLPSYFHSKQVLHCTCKLLATFDNDIPLSVVACIESPQFLVHLACCLPCQLHVLSAMVLLGLFPHTEPGFRSRLFMFPRKDIGLSRLASKVPARGM